MQRKRELYLILENPTKIIGTDDGWVKGIECIKWSWENRI